ncbi:MAG: hypothetical protein HYZ25_09335 [Chloroflexi bacterium]|nr:hypothetical protein [Chloroflexota bacterium]
MSTEIKRPVFFCGENPGMTLYTPGTEQVTAIVSYWLCTDSLHGIGHALVLWLSESAELQHGGIFTDNRALAEVLIQRLTRYFPEFQGVLIDELAYIEAECGHTYDGERYLATCQSSETRVEAEWRNVLDRKQIVWPHFPAGEVAYDLTTVICPCGVGRIRLNGKEIEGEIQVAQSAEGRSLSSAFLAFAETWIGPVQD